MAHHQIRILSVRQPFADEIIYGDKWNELRSRSTPYHGPIYIHASAWSGSPKQGSPGPGVTGAIIGRVELLDCICEYAMEMVHDHLLRRAKLPDWLSPLADFLKKFPRTSWKHGIGEWNWILADPTPLRSPFRTPGKLNLWRMQIDSEHLATIDATTSEHGPKASDYPTLEIPESAICDPPGSPGSLTRRLFTFVNKHGDKGVSRESLKKFAGKYGLRPETVINDLRRLPAFELVPGKPKNQNWWRTKDVVEEVGLISRRWQPTKRQAK